MIWNLTASGSLIFCDAGLKKLAAALLVVVAVTLRFAGGEMSRSAVFERFKGFVDIFTMFKIVCSCRWSLTSNPNVLIICLIESGVYKRET